MILNRNQSKVLSIIVIASISYLPIFFINGLLWDDYTISGSISFETVKATFSDNGVYNVGVAHFHYLLNYLNGNSVFVSRLISFLFLVNLAVLFYSILKKLFINETLVLSLNFFFILLPFFGSCFTQIVLPYIICFNLFLASLIYLINYIQLRRNKLLFSYFVLLLLSCITNSFIFFIAPCVLAILVLLKDKIFNYKKTLITVTSITVLAVLFFMLFKVFFMKVNPDSVYANYNKITVSRLIVDGPIKTINHIPKSIYLLFNYVFNVLKQLENLFFVLLFFIPIFIVLKKMQWQSISIKFYLLSLLVSIAFLFSAIFPYAVVGKVNVDMLDYSNRYDMLLIIGFSILFSTSILFFIKSKVYGKIVLSFVFSVMFICKISVFTNYYYNLKLQDKFYTTYLSKLDSTKSYLIYEKGNVNLNWRFYEIGGLLREHNSAQNVLFIHGKSKFYNGKQLNSALVENYNKQECFSITEFDLNNYQIKKIEFKYKERLSFIDFISLMVNPNNINFEVMEL